LILTITQGHYDENNRKTDPGDTVWLPVTPAEWVCTDNKKQEPPKEINPTLSATVARVRNVNHPVDDRVIISLALSPRCPETGISTFDHAPFILSFFARLFEAGLGKGNCLVMFLQWYSVPVLTVTVLLVCSYAEEVPPVDAPDAMDFSYAQLWRYAQQQCETKGIAPSEFTNSWLAVRRCLKQTLDVVQLNEDSMRMDIDNQQVILGRHCP
uniref:Uncharacterized protein n=1 Tax=Anopheles atroparvus TaxID=41427 RepID=A0A182IKH1_ANOAO